MVGWEGESVKREREREQEQEQEQELIGLEIIIYNHYFSF